MQSIALLLLCVIMEQIFLFIIASALTQDFSVIRVMHLLQVVLMYLIDTETNKLMTCSFVMLLTCYVFNYGYEVNVK